MRTLRAKILMAFIGLVGLIFLLFFIGMELFVAPYYYKQKVHMMEDTVKQVRTIIMLGESPVDIIEDLTYLEDIFEGKMGIYQMPKEMVIDKEDVERFTQGRVIDEPSTGDGKSFIIETDYPVEKTRWLIYYEYLPENKIVILQLSVTAIEDTLKVLRVLSLYLGLFILVIAVIWAIIISKNISRPIKELTVMAGEIRQLNFDVHYSGDRKDEIGQLGKTFNALTWKLNTTIRELQHELNKEKKLDVMRKEFVAQVSHELQTPLTIIHGYIEALEDEMVVEEAEKNNYYKIIHDESEKMSGMIKELLQLSELESKKITMKKEVLELNEFFDKLNADYQKLMNDDKIELIYIGLLEQVIYQGDWQKLEQAFRNILNNAKKYAISSSRINLEIKKVDKTVQVIISNTGPFIEETELVKIFDSLYKGNNSQGKEGFGIGLAVAAKIFRYHGIQYCAENTDKGVAIIVTIFL